VPKVPPETIKKVAATKGHKVRRTKFCFWDFAGGGVSGAMLCGFQAVVLAVANFDGFLLKRLTLTTSAVAAEAPGYCGFQGFGKLVREFENTVIWMLCKKNFREIFCGGTRTEVTEGYLLSAIGSQPKPS